MGKMSVLVLFELKLISTQFIFCREQTALAFFGAFNQTDEEKDEALLKLLFKNTILSQAR